MTTGPGSRFINVPSDALEAFLQSKGFKRETFRSEVVYVRTSRRCQHTHIKVYTSIADGVSSARGCGEDAIRVIARFERAAGNDNRSKGFSKCLNKAKRIHRTGSVDKIFARIMERVMESAEIANKFLDEGGCFACCRPAQHVGGGVR